MMNPRIEQLARDHLRHEMYAAYGEIVEGDYYEFDPEELHDFVRLIVEECIDYCGENLSKTVGGALKIHLGVRE
jgi:hypothetical protein